MSARQNHDDNWWSFMIDRMLRRNLAEEPYGMAQFSVEPQNLDYSTYLALDTLLAAQKPLSLIPDERAFIITHQLVELAFKLMIFDLAVISRTLTALLQAETPESLRAYLSDELFWRPALTASSRIYFGSRSVLPLTVQYLSSQDDENFNREEFFMFRDYLGTASGFQSAQFRLIQRAFGKSGLLSIRLFPASHNPQQHATEATNNSFVTIVDESIVTHDAAVASPQADSALAAIAQLDDLAHWALEKCAGLGGAAHELPTIAGIPQSDVDRAVDAMRKMVAHDQRQRDRSGDQVEGEDSALRLFRQDLEDVVRRENARRALLGAARMGALNLRATAPSSPFALVLGRLVLADIALNGEHSASFLSIHFTIARDLLKKAGDADETNTLPGTGGGGVNYLGYIRKYLVPLFPLGVAFRDLAECVAQTATTPDSTA